MAFLWKFFQRFLNLGSEFQDEEQFSDIKFRPGEMYIPAGCAIWGSDQSKVDWSEELARERLMALITWILEGNVQDPDDSWEVQPEEPVLFAQDVAYFGSQPWLLEELVPAEIIYLMAKGTWYISMVNNIPVLGGLFRTPAEGWQIVIRYNQFFAGDLSSLNFYAV